MAAIQWMNLSEVVTWLDEELGGLEPGCYSAVSAQVDAFPFTHGWVELTLANTARSGEATVTVHLLPALDGEHFVEGGGGVRPPDFTAVSVFHVSSSSGEKRRCSEIPIQLPPFPFRFLVHNQGGYAFAATGNTLKLRCAALGTED